MGAIGKKNLLEHILKQFDRQSGASHRSGQPKPIASLPTHFELKATRVDWVGNELVYCDEIPIRVRPAVPLDIDSDGKQLFVNYRFEVSALSRDFNRQAAQYEIIIASYPYSKNWVGSAPFKRSINKRAEDYDRREEIQEEIKNSASPFQALEALDFDPNQGASPRVTAGVHRFERQASHSFDERSSPSKRVIKARYNSRKELPPDITRFGKCIEQWVFGAVKNKSEAMTWLRESPTAKELQSLTASGDLFNELCRGLQYPKAKDLEPESIELGNEVLEAAVWKALAGPLTDDVPRWVGNGNHAGKPVTAMLQHQYLYMMHAVNERFNRSLLASYAPTYKPETVSQEILNAVELQRQLHESLKMQEESIQLAYAHIEPEKFLALLFEQARHGADLAGQIAFSSAYVATRLWFDDIEQMQLEEALEIIQGFTGEYGATLAVFVNEHINNHFK